MLVRALRSCGDSLARDEFGGLVRAYPLDVQGRFA
jgi:hypothetical protein